MRSLKRTIFRYKSYEPYDTYKKTANLADERRGRRQSINKEDAIALAVVIGIWVVALVLVSIAF